MRRGCGLPGGRAHTGFQGQGRAAVGRHPGGLGGLRLLRGSVRPAVKRPGPPGARVPGFGRRASRSERLLHWTARPTGRPARRPLRTCRDGDNEAPPPPSDARRGVRGDCEGGPETVRPEFVSGRLEVAVIGIPEPVGITLETDPAVDDRAGATALLWWPRPFSHPHPALRPDLRLCRRPAPCRPAPCSPPRRARRSSTRCAPRPPGSTRRPACPV